MKMFKKMSSACMAFLCAAILMVTCAGAVYAADESIAASESDYLITQAEQLITSIIQLGDAEMDQAIENYPDDPSITALQGWKTSKEEVGAFKELGESQIEEKDDEYIITVPAVFENYNGEFELVIDKKAGSLSSTAFNVNYPFSVNMKRAALNTLMGLGTVFLVLAFLMFIISLFKYIPNGSNKKTAAAPAPAPAPVPAAAPVVEETDDTELVAVIAAAIAAAEGTTPDGFVVRSIRRVGGKRR